MCGPSLTGLGLRVFGLVQLWLHGGFRSKGGDRVEHADETQLPKDAL